MNAGAAGRAQDARPASRRMTVADMVQTAVIGDHGANRDGGEPQNLTSFSPDGRRVAIILHRGDLASNVVTASLLVFRVDNPAGGLREDTVATFRSSSNRPAISQLRWLNDNVSLLFVGEAPEELPQIHRVNVVTHEIRQLTSASAVISAYSVTPSGNHLVYTTFRPPATSTDSSARAAGRVVTAPHVAAVLGIRDDDREQQSTRLFAVDVQRGVTTPAPEVGTATLPGEPMRTVGIGTCDDFWQFVASPDGRYVVRNCAILRAPDGWRAYSDPLLRSGMEPGGFGPRQYVVFDLQAETASVLIDAPLPLFGSRPAPIWILDGPSLVISNVYVPLAGNATREEVTSTIAVVHVDVATGAIRPIVSGMSRRRSIARATGSRWDSGSATLYLDLQDSGRRAQPPAAYRYVEGSWTAAPTTGQRAAPAVNSNGEIVFTLEQSLNDPPVLVATDRRSGKKSRVLDPNAALSGFQLGRVAEVAWQSGDGAKWRGALHYPPDYRTGTRYPLVIQTHGYEPDRYSLDGAFTTGYAAQPLAGRGFIVLQMADVPADALGTAREAVVAQAGIESAIDHLVSLGLVDRGRVGVLGFSRTVAHVKYALTHSAYPIAAAVIIDGVDMSYVSYALFGHIQPLYEAMIGAGPPFGEALDVWQREAPGFNLDKVRAAVRIVAIRPESVLGEWETFSGLRRLGKAVELYYIPDGVHLLFKPRERLEAAQGSVDWFCFWLLGEEDGDPAKATQYARWRALRAR